MDKNDLLNEDDFFSVNDKDETPSQQNAPSSSTNEDDLFTEIEFGKENEQAEPEIVLNDEEQPVPIPAEPEPVTEPAAPEPEPDQSSTSGETSSYRYEFEDFNQGGVNYKPIIIGFIVAIILIAGGYFLWQYLTAEEEPEVAEQVEQGPSPEEIALAKFYSNLSGKTHSQFNQINHVISRTSSKNKLSSLMLYDEDFMFEIYSSDRAALAKFFRTMQADVGSKNISLDATTDRPGKSGGVFGQFRIQLPSSSAGNTEVTSPLASGGDLKAWINGLAQANGLKVSDSRQTTTAALEGHNGTQLEISLKGSLESLTAFLTQLVNGNKNLIFHKVGLISTDLKNYSPKRYQLRLIVKAFI